MIVEKLKSEGLTLKPDGENLVVGGKLSDEQRQFIRTHKSAILAELKPANDLPIDPNLGAMIRRMAAYWNYTDEDLTFALEMAEKEPGTWQQLCLQDSKRSG